MFPVSLDRLLKGNATFDDDLIKRNIADFEYVRGIINGSADRNPTNPYFSAWSCFQSYEFKNFLAASMARTIMTWFYSWGIPNQEAIQTLTKLSPIVEIGAGRGYWASLIKKAGGQIVCYDSKLDNGDESLNFFKVRTGSFGKIADHPDHTLFLCWSPYDEPLAYDCLKAYKGKTLVYVGEGAGGCTGCGNFHSLLEKEWDEVICVDIPQWEGIHDQMIVYERREKA